MCQRDLPSKAQTDAAAALVRGVEGQEYVIAAGFGNSTAIVADLYLTMSLSISAERQGNEGVRNLVRRSNCVPQKVQDRLRQQLRISIQAHRRRLNFDPHVDGTIARGGTSKLCQFLSPALHLELPPSHVRCLRELP